MKRETVSDAYLRPEQRRAAALLASGRQQREVAVEVDRSTKQIQRWLGREDFRQLVRKLREDMLAETPTAEATLVAALTATRPDGAPSWPDRIAAAKAILSTPVTSPDAQKRAARVERIYVAPEDDGMPKNKGVTERCGGRR